MLRLLLFCFLLLSLLNSIISQQMHHAQTQTTCDFTINFPATSYPTFKELLVGTLRYNNTVDPIVGYTGYPAAHQLLSFTGSRTLWMATASDPTAFHYVSTSIILGLVPVNTYTYFLNNTDGFPVLQFGARLFIDQYFTNGQQAFLFWDNYIYPSGDADLLDPSGILVYLDVSQPPSVTVAGVGNIYTVYSFDGNPSIGNDLTDDTTLAYQGPGHDPAGFGGSFELYNCRVSDIQPPFPIHRISNQPPRCPRSGYARFACPL